MVTLSKEIIELLAVFGTFYLAVMGVLVPMLRGVRKDVKETRTELKADIDRVELRVDRVETKLDKETTSIRTELRAINDRIDGTNMRVDRLVDALLTAPEKVS